MRGMENPLTALTLDQLRRRTSIKWTLYPPDVLPLWVAEMDVPLAQPIIRAVAHAMEEGDTGYATNAEYADALAGFAKRHWDWTFDAASTVLVADVMTGVAEVLQVVTERGAAVVVNPPVYPPFFDFVTHTNRAVVNAPLGPDRRLDLQALEHAFAQAREGGRDAAYLLCNPHNPTGTVHTAAELTAVADLASRYGVRVVADEIHAPLQRVGRTHVPYLSVPGSERGVAMLSASKAWNLAGLKAALAVAGPEAAADLQRIPEIVSHGPSHVGAIAQVAAWREGEEWLAALQRGLDHNRQLAGELFAQHLPDVGYAEPDATYLAWLDCRALGLGDDPATVFNERGRVALMSGLPFGPGGEGHARINLGTSPEILTEAVRRMAAAV